MSKRISLIIAVVVIAAGANPDPPRAASFVDPTAKARLEVAQDAMNRIYGQLKAGKKNAASAPLLQAWVDRYGDSLIAAATNKEELIKAFEYHVTTARNRQTAVADLFKRGEMTELDVLDARYQLLRAEGELAKARAGEMR